MVGANISSYRTPTTMSKKSLSLSSEWTLTFVLLLSIIMAVTVSLGRTFAISIYSIFPLCMESNILEKSTNKSVSSKFFCTMSFYDSTDCQNLWCCGLIFTKTVLIFSNFLNFCFDAIEKQSIINLSCYGCKSSASLVLCDSEVTFLGEVGYSLSLCCVLVIYGITKLEQ